MHLIIDWKDVACKVAVFSVTMQSKSPVTSLALKPSWDLNLGPYKYYFCKLVATIAAVVATTQVVVKIKTTWYLLVWSLASYC